jgi:hypothetical protein
MHQKIVYCDCAESAYSPSSPAQAANDNDPLPVLRLVRAPARLSRCEAAAYVGVSPVAFDTLVASGLMPPQLPLGIRRRI